MELYIRQARKVGIRLMININEMSSEMVINLILEQVGYFRSETGFEPNLIILGENLVTKINNDRYFHEEYDGYYLGDYRLVQEPFNKDMLAVGYSPFLNKQDKVTWNY